MKLRHLALLLVAMTAGRPAFADVFRSLAKGVTRAAAGAKVERVAVLPFLATNGQHSEDGVVMSERLIGSLVQLGKVRVVERGLLESIMKEHYLDASGIVSPEGRRQLGKILSVDAVVTGSYVSFGRRSTLNARLIEVDTGDILYARTDDVDIDWFDPYPVETDAFGGLWRGENGSCRDLEAQVDRLERELLEIKSRYWMTGFQAGDAFSERAGSQ